MLEIKSKKLICILKIQQSIIRIKRAKHSLFDIIDINNFRTFYRCHRVTKLNLIYDENSYKYKKEKRTSIHEYNT